jgi:hypothetical protein
MMRSKLCVGLMALGLSVSAAAQKVETFQDEFKQDLIDFRAASKAAPTDAEVGDANSFGRNVKWLGLLQTGSVSFQSDCTPAPGDPPLGPDDRCVTLNAAPGATSFDLSDIGRITIPGKSSNSLLCHWLSPILFYQFNNTTGVFQPNANFRLSPYIVVESPVLADPALINPLTGLPFGGSLETGFSATYSDSRSLDVNDRQTTRHSQSRTCIAGFLSKRNLIEGFGLTEAQAKELFKRDITLRFGVRGNAAMVSNALVLYGLRIVGD